MVFGCPIHPLNCPPSSRRVLLKGGRALQSYATLQTRGFVPAAAKELLDRGHGRPRQTIAVEDQSTVIIVDRSCKDVVEAQAALEDQSAEGGSGQP